MPDEARRRLAIEHDDRIWSAREVLPLAIEHGLPFIADTLHNVVRPSEPPLAPADLHAEAARSWRALGLRPKHHLASQRPGSKPGAHADFIALEDLQPLLAALDDGPADVMLEAKCKDLALLELRGQGAHLARRLGVVLR